ncbi:hypothetical protein OsJ_15665 [Oryza sativa Japonica Group]|uniref:Uncharacterized protein n=1 Tax=Oryza sativa subsp. japonica TaxID=39947 RepID=B9FGF2_ORYSJ|nr:hypothetical protein OsJ_15665 [Oryza sativa Japonica Group]
MSTGGLMNKMTGRIGDSPLIGSGEGKAIIRSTLARDVAAVMEFRGAGLQEAIDYCVKERLDEGFIGLIAVFGTGEVAHGERTDRIIITGLPDQTVVGHPVQRHSGQGDHDKVQSWMPCGIAE